MNRFGYGLKLMSYTLIVAVFFAAGYGAGRINGKNSVKTEAAEATEYPQPVLAQADGQEEQETRYIVRIRSGKLYLDEVTGEETNTVAVHNISESVYPKDDIEQLKAGMEFDSKSEAMSMFENFSS